MELEVSSMLDDEKQFKGKTPSPFQLKAFRAIDREEDVIVSADTGNGKTLAAEYAIEHYKRIGKKSIYTAPIKMLSNQKLNQFQKDDEKDYLEGKYNELRKVYGEKLVGLMTGDRVINPNAPVMVMTTEILCNKLYDNPKEIEDSVGCIIHDEIHNINDKSRGTVWEESIIKMPKSCALIGLSATIPNSQELCDWVSNIRNKKVNNIVHNERIVPLEYSYFDKKLGPCTEYELKKELLVRNNFKRVFTSHMDIVPYLKKNDMLNALIIYNSRKSCENNAEELSTQFDFLNKKEKEVVKKVLVEFEDKYPFIKDVNSWRVFSKIAMKGIAFLHSGLIPIMKELSEKIINTGMCRVCYATDAASQGVNAPFKTVVMEHLETTDGKSKIKLSGAVFNQRAGRAGRRGIDTKGYVFVLSNLETGDIVDLSKIKNEDIESQLKLSFNRVLKHTHEDIDLFLKDSLGAFQHANILKKSEQQITKLQSKLSLEIDNIYSHNKCKNLSDKKCPLNNNINIINSELESEQTCHRNKISLTKEEIKHQVGLSLLPIKCSNGNKRDCIIKNSKITQLRNEINNIKNKIPESPVEKHKLDYNGKLILLNKLGYIDEDKNLLYRGKICSKIYTQELLVSELIGNGLFHNYDVDTINAYLGGISFESGKKVKSNLKNGLDYTEIVNTISNLSAIAQQCSIDYKPYFSYSVAPIVYEWSKGCSLKTINSNSNMFEGDFVRICKNTIDLLSQIKGACHDDKYIVDKSEECISKLKRDVISLMY